MALDVVRDVVERNEPVRGIAIPAMIRNGRWFFTRMNVYEDGLIDCWGLVDRTRFRAKVESGWVQSACPEGEQFSVHHVGAAVLGPSEWDRTPGALVAYVEALIHEQTPDKRWIRDFGGVDVRLFGKVRWAWPPEGSPAPVRPPSRVDPAPPSLGGRAEVLWRVGGETYLASVRGFPDGLVQVRGVPGVGDVGVDALREALAAGTLVGLDRVDGWLVIEDLGRLRIGRTTWAADPNDMVAEFMDRMAQLRGNPGLVAACAGAFEAWQKSPAPDTLKTLREAYFAIPSHMRRYVGDMDEKDWPVRRALGLDQESDE